MQHVLSKHFEDCVGHLVLLLQLTHLFWVWRGLIYYWGKAYHITYWSFIIQLAHGSLHLFVSGERILWVGLLRWRQGLFALKDLGLVLHG